MKWVTAWYAAPVQMVSAGLSGRTLRQIVHLHAGGEQLRIRLSNRYGDGPVTVSSISVGESSRGTVSASKGERGVFFGGESFVTLEPGREGIVSDPVSLAADAFKDLSITLFLKEGENLTGHVFAQQTSYVSGPGEFASTAAELSPIASPLMTTSWWLITGVDVLSPVTLNALVAFGSSTTDGVGSTLNANRRWPDHLARRLHEAGASRFMSVINAGLGGNQLTSSGGALPSQAGAIPRFLFGESGMDRLAWDVLGQPGATDLIVNIGSNDLRAGVAGERVIEALQRLAKEARSGYRRVFGTTILPGGYSPRQIEKRRAVNTWLLEQGKDWFDAVFDFATPLRSADDEARLNPAYDSGDGVHPNDEGYRVMAEAVDLKQLSGSTE